MRPSIYSDVPDLSTVSERDSDVLKIIEEEDLEGTLGEETIGQKVRLVVLRGEQLKELAVTPAASR